MYYPYSWLTNEKRLSVSLRSKVNRWRTFENRQAIDARLICTSDWTPGVSNTILKFSFSENISFLPLWGDVGVRRPTKHPAITNYCDGFCIICNKLNIFGVGLVHICDGVSGQIAKEMYYKFRYIFSTNYK